MSDNNKSDREKADKPKADQGKPDKAKEKPQTFEGTEGSNMVIPGCSWHVVKYDRGEPPKRPGAKRREIKLLRHKKGAG